MKPDLQRYRYEIHMRVFQNEKGGWGPWFVNTDTRSPPIFPEPDKPDENGLYRPQETDWRDFLLLLRTEATELASLSMSLSELTGGTLRNLLAEKKTWYQYRLVRIPYEIIA